MSVPRTPPPSDAAHERHDALLVSQFAAGEPLDPAEALEAGRLVASCRACATLAADLKAIAGAVAWEPLPPRRRDFRIDAAQAERLRGSPWTRFLRRFSLPRSGALRPAAAGVMSLGLLLVVAGNLWPAGESVDQAVPAAPPEASALVEKAIPGMTTAPAAEAVEASPVAEAPAEQMTIAQASAGTSLAQDTAGAGEPEAPSAVEAPVMEGEVSATELSDSFDAAASPAQDDALTLEARAERGGDSALEEDSADRMAADALDTTVAPSLGAVVAPGVDEPDDGALRAPATAGPAEVVSASEVTVPADDALDVETVLVWFGVVLAVGGAIALLLAWLARRGADPLLR